MPSLRERVRRSAPRPTTNRILQPSGDAILEWIGVNDLLVDDYQRKVSTKRVHEIVRNFNSDTFGIITVALRENGDLYVVDGQHRVSAIKRMQEEGENQEVLCVVISGWTSTEEAKFFSESQRSRATITPGQAHHAEVFAHDPTAAAIDVAVRSAGYHIAPQDDSEWSGRIKAVGALYRITNTYGVEFLEWTLCLCASAWGAATAPMEPTINGVTQFLVMYPRADFKRVAAKLGATSEEELIAKGREIATSMGYRVQEGIARELFNRYNHKMTANRLTGFEDQLEGVRRYQKRAGVAPRTPGAQR